MEHYIIFDAFRDRNAAPGFPGWARRTMAIVPLLLLFTASPTCEAQLRVEIRQPETIWFDSQTKRYVPEDVTVELTVRNTSPDSVFQVQLEFYVQMRLQFADGSRSSVLDIAESIPPGDSLNVRLPLRVVKAPSWKQQELEYPQQLMWTLRWEDGRSTDRFVAEGQAVVVVDGACPDGMVPGLAGHLVLKDTVQLLPGEDGNFMTTYEAEGCVYAADGKSYIVTHLHLELLPTFSIFDTQLSVERLLPESPMGEVTVSGTDTLKTRFRISIPYGLGNDHLYLQQWVDISVDEGCLRPRISLGLDYQPLRIHHAPGRRMWLGAGLTSDSHGGARRAFNMRSWCGTAPKGPDSLHVSVSDNGETVPLESFDPQRYSSELRPVHAIFAIDISHSIDDASRRRIAEILLEWKNTMAPERDSITVFTLSDSARLTVAADAPADSLESFLASMPKGEHGAFYPQLKDVVAYAIDRKKNAAVSLIVATDGWFAGAEFCQDTLDFVRNVHHVSCFSFSPSAFFNYDAIRWRLTPKSILYNYVSSRRSWPLYEMGRFMYAIPCWSGREREERITIRDWCGGDTVILKPYVFPESIAPVSFYTKARDTTLVGGGTVDCAIQYVGADSLRADHAEFLIEYDSTLLSLRSMSIPRATHTVLHRTWDTPGKAHIITAVNAEGGAGTLGTLHFTSTVVADTVRTPLKISAWSRAMCIPTVTFTVAMVTLLPATTSVKASHTDQSFSIAAIYPQPASGILHFNLLNVVPGLYRYRIMDILGRVFRQSHVLTQRAGAQTISVTLPQQLPAGVYMLEVQMGDALRVRRFHVHGAD